MPIPGRICRPVIGGDMYGGGGTPSPSFSLALGL